MIRSIDFSLCMFIGNVPVPTNSQAFDLARPSAKIPNT